MGGGEWPPWTPERERNNRRPLALASNASTPASGFEALSGGSTAGAFSNPPGTAAKGPAAGPSLPASPDHRPACDLAIAHLYQNTSNHDRANLAALCQRRHNRVDAPIQQKLAAETRRREWATYTCSMAWRDRERTDWGIAGLRGGTGPQRLLSPKLRRLHLRTHICSQPPIPGGGHIGSPGWRDFILQLPIGWLC